MPCSFVGAFVVEFSFARPRMFAFSFQGPGAGGIACCGHCCGLLPAQQAAGRGSSAAQLPAPLPQAGLKKRPCPAYLQLLKRWYFDKEVSDLPQGGQHPTPGGPPSLSLSLSLSLFSLSLSLSLSLSQG